MDDNQPGQLMGSTPEPSNSYEVDDICRIRSMQKEGENVVLNIAKGGEAFLSVRIPGPMQGWWTGNYRVKLTIEPYRDPIADQLNAEAVCRMAIEHGVMRLKETGSDAFEAYNVGELPEPGGIRQNALDEEAKRADVHFRWVKRGERYLGFVFLRKDMSDEELFKFAYRPPQ
jgi:hypothetical protein